MGLSGANASKPPSELFSVNPVNPLLGSDDVLQISKGFFCSASTPRGFLGRDLRVARVARQIHPSESRSGYNCRFQWKLPSVTADPFQTGEWSNQTSGRAYRRHATAAGFDAAEEEGTLVPGSPVGRRRRRRLDVVGGGEGEGARGGASPAVRGRRQGATRGLARALQPQGVCHPAPRRRQLAPGPSSSSSSTPLAAIRFLMTTATAASNETDLSANSHREAHQFTFKPLNHGGPCYAMCESCL